MRIKVINPNTTRAMTKQIYKAAIRYAHGDTRITAVNPANGPVSIENFYDEGASIIGVMEEVQKGTEDGYDAFVIACFGDPGLYAAREIATAPVIGIAEASMHLATMVAAKFSIIAVVPRAKLTMEHLVFNYGMERKCASIRAPSLGVLNLEEQPEKSFAHILDEGHKAIREDGAEAICLGCAGMADFAEKMEKELGVPVFEGVSAAVKIAETIVNLGKMTSKHLYFAYPEEKEYKGILNFLEP